MASDKPHDSSHARYLYGSKQLFASDSQAAFHLQNVFPTVNVNEYLKMGTLPSGFIKAGADEAAQTGTKGKMLPKDGHDVCKKESTAVSYSQYPYLQSYSGIVASTASAAMPMRQRGAYSVMPNVATPAGKVQGQGYQWLGNPYLGQSGCYGFPAQVPYLQQSNRETKAVASGEAPQLQWDAKCSSATAAPSHGMRAHEQQLLWMGGASSGRAVPLVPSAQMPYLMPYGKMAVPVKVPQWQKENAFTMPGGCRTWINPQWLPRPWMPYPYQQGRGVAVLPPSSQYPYAGSLAKDPASPESAEGGKEQKDEFADASSGPKKSEGEEGESSRSPSANSASAEAQSARGDSSPTPGQAAGTSGGTPSGCSPQPSSAQEGCSTAQALQSALPIYTQAASSGAQPPQLSSELVSSQAMQAGAQQAVRTAPMMAVSNFMSGSFGSVPRYQMLYSGLPGPLKRPYPVQAQSGEDALTQAPKRKKVEGPGTRMMVPKAAGGQQAVVMPVGRGPSLARRRMVFISNPWTPRAAPQPSAQPAPPDTSNA